MIDGLIGSVPGCHDLLEVRLVHGLQEWNHFNRGHISAPASKSTAGIGDGHLFTLLKKGVFAVDQFVIPADDPRSDG